MISFIFFSRVNLTSRNTHDIVFRTIEIGVALWFPCVLWNCIRPEQLWCLNPKKILERFPPLRDCKDTKTIRKSPRNNSESSSISTNSDGKSSKVSISMDIKVSKSQNQISKFSFEPKNEWSFFISALASKMSQLKIMAYYHAN